MATGRGDRPRSRAMATHARDEEGEPDRDDETASLPVRDPAGDRPEDHGAYGAGKEDKSDLAGGQAVDPAQHKGHEEDDADDDGEQAKGKDEPSPETRVREERWLDEGIGRPADPRDEEDRQEGEGAQIGEVVEIEVSHQRAEDEGSQDGAEKVYPAFPAAFRRKGADDEGQGDQDEDGNEEEVGPMQGARHEASDDRPEADRQGDDGRDEAEYPAAFRDLEVARDRDEYEGGDGRIRRPPGGRAPRRRRGRRSGRRSRGGKPRRRCPRPSR